MKQALLRGDLREMADILDRSWNAKRATAMDISNPRVDLLHKVAMENGAWAGKISGAGGGGYMMFITDPENRFSLISAMRAAGFDAGTLHFNRNGAETWIVS